TLRWAIANAAPGDTIDFALSYPATITLTSGELLLDKSLTIKGPGAPSLTVSGNHTGRVFYVAGGTTTATLSGLTIADGHGGAGIDNRGGTLTVTDCTISGNSGILIGGIGNSGTLTIINTPESGNSATAQNDNSDGGGIGNSGTLTIINSTVSGNSAFANGGVGYGGGIFNSGTLTIINSTVSGNSARVGGGILIWGSS